MNFILITSSDLPVYTQEGRPPGYSGAILPGRVSGAEGNFGLIVLQEKEIGSLKTRFHFFNLLKKIFISHLFPPAFLQALFALGDDITYYIEGHGKIKLRQGEYIMVPAPGKNLKAELQEGSEYKIFEAVYPEETVREMNGLFPQLQQILYDQDGNWEPAAREATLKIKDVILEMLDFPFDNRSSENVYYEQQLKRLFYLMVVQGEAAGARKLYSDKEAAYNIQEMLLRNLQNPPPTTVIAERFQLSVHRIKEIFRKVFGLTPVPYVHRTRMEIAYTLVTKTNTPIKIISAELGFKKSQSFATKFKKRYRKTPMELRNEINKG